MASIWGVFHQGSPRRSYASTRCLIVVRSARWAAARLSRCQAGARRQHAQAGDRRLDQTIPGSTCSHRQCLLAHSSVIKRLADSTRFGRPGFPLAAGRGLVSLELSGLIWFNRVPRGVRWRGLCFRLWRLSELRRAARDLRGSLIAGHAPAPGLPFERDRIAVSFGSPLCPAVKRKPSENQLSQFQPQ